jgi:hypothetical protein
MEQNSQDLRHAEMEIRANLASNSGNNDTKQAIDWLWSSKAHAAMYQKIKAIRGKYNRSGFTSIDVPTSWPSALSDPSLTRTLPDPKKATDWKTIDLPEEIVYYLLLRNRLHFGHTHGSPFTTPRFSQKINWMASTETSELILQGDYDSTKLSHIQALLL